METRDDTPLRRAKIEVEGYKESPFNTRVLRDGVDPMSVLDSETPTYLLPDPNRDPVSLPRLDTARQERLIREGADRQAEALDETVRRAEENANRARLRTLMSLGGRNIMKAFTGAPVQTGVRENLALQREAEARARELERNATTERARLQAESNLRAQMVSDETAFRNAQQATREEQAGREQTDRFMDAANTLTGRRVDASTQRYEAYLDYLAEEAKTRARSGGDPSDVLDLIKVVSKNPELAETQDIQALAQGMGLRDISQVGGSVIEASSGTRDLETINSQIKQIRERLQTGLGEPIQAEGMSGWYLGKDGGTTQNVEEAMRKPISALERQRLNEEVGMLEQRQSEVLERTIQRMRERKDGQGLMAVAQLLSEEGLVPQEDVRRLKQEAGRYQAEGRERPAPDTLRKTVLDLYGEPEVEEESGDGPTSDASAGPRRTRNPQPSSSQPEPNRSRPSVVEQAREMLASGTLGDEAANLVSGIQALEDVQGREAQSRRDELVQELQQRMESASYRESAESGRSLQEQKQADRRARERSDLEGALERDLALKNSRAWQFLREDQKSKISARIKRYRREIRDLGGDPSQVGTHANR
jgi:hypothetical protein